MKRSGLMLQETNESPKRKHEQRFTTHGDFSINKLHKPCKVWLQWETGRRQQLTCSHVIEQWYRVVCQKVIVRWREIEIMWRLLARRSIRSIRYIYMSHLQVPVTTQPGYPGAGYPGGGPIHGMPIQQQPGVPTAPGTGMYQEYVFVHFEKFFGTNTNFLKFWGKFSKFSDLAWCYWSNCWSN